MTKTEAFFNNIKGKKIGFIGLGVSHNDLIKMFLKKGLDITVYDKKTSDKLGEIYEELKNMGAEFYLGENYLERLEICDIIFRTPGMYFDNNVIAELRKNGKIITSEMEVFFDLCPCKIYAVTGSDGKTTTTTIISEFLKAEGKRVFKGGNIGKALLPMIEEIRDEDAAVVELSSFQLMSMRKSPDVAVITNIAPNHLDVHKTMEEYINCKKNLISHQNAFSVTVLNADNELTNNLSDIVRGKLVKFSRVERPLCGAYVFGEKIIYNDYGKETYVMNVHDIKIPGVHNIENYLTAISAVWNEVSVENIVKVAKEFGGVEHRIEFVRELDGIKYYNDSIATSPTRVIAGLKSFNQKLIVIAGGYDKKIPFEPMAEYICEKVKVLIILGVTADKIEKAITECSSYKKGNPEIIRVQTLEEAVETAKNIAKSGDIVTLSPACASFDLYPNFEARGNHFKRIVNNLK